MSASGNMVDIVALRRLHARIGAIIATRGLTETLQAVVDGVVDVVGFEVAAISYVHMDGSFEVLAVAGSSEARAALLGRRSQADAYDEEFALADRWGALRFVPHERLPDGRGQGWVPALDMVQGAVDAWHPQDALFAPLRSASGDLVGVLSVDLPRDRRKPGFLQREMLELFAGQAGIAVDNARLTERLQTSEDAFRMAFERAGIGTALLSMDPVDQGRYFRVNAAFCHIVGRTEQELLSLHVLQITHPDDRQRDQDAAGEALTGERTVYNVEKRYIRGDGSIVWVAVTSALVFDVNGTSRYVISQVEDISDRRAVREELTHRAGHDDLTGLPNRHTAHRRLTDAVAAAHRHGRNGALLFCDLDGFKAINDTYGHAAGDRVLIVMAQRLAATCRRYDTVARLGGDEFVVLAENTTPDKVSLLSERLRRSVSQPIVLDGVLVKLSISIGQAQLHDHTDPDEVMRAADSDMYQNKRSSPRDQRTSAE